jgi:hypothetical protein
MNIRIVLLCLLVGAAAAPVCAQVTTQTIQPFKSLCIGEQASGFDWKNDKWEHTKFKPEKYILQKIDYEERMLSKNYIERPISCSKPKATNVDKEKDIVLACYAANKFGQVASYLFDAADCFELFKDGKIQEIQCSGVGKFKPNGSFVMLPSNISMDLSTGNEKDSLVLTVGVCGIL